MADERDFTRWLQKRLSQPHPCVRVGVGDDMAILAEMGETLLVGSDMLVDGTHFDSRRHDPAEIGRKAAACALSDCAAMCVRPIAATVSIAAPRETGTRPLISLVDALAGLVEDYGARVVGGDTVSWSRALAVDVTMLALPYTGVEPVRRDRGRAGDGLFVTGALGGSLLGRHLTFEPRIHRAREIAQAGEQRLHAMIDITDGLAVDADRLAGASGVGAVLDEQRVLSVAHDDARGAAEADGQSILRHVLSDGEDFELLVAADLDDALAGTQRLTRVGELIENPGLWILTPDGTRHPLDPAGYQHFQ